MASCPPPAAAPRRAVSSCGQGCMLQNARTKRQSSKWKQCLAPESRGGEWRVPVFRARLSVALAAAALRLHVIEENGGGLSGGRRQRLDALRLLAALGDLLEIDPVRLRPRLRACGADAHQNAPDQRPNTTDHLLNTDHRRRYACATGPLAPTSSERTRTRRRGARAGAA